MNLESQFIILSYIFSLLKWRFEESIQDFFSFSTFLGSKFSGGNIKLLLNSKKRNEIWMKKIIGQKQLTLADFYPFSSNVQLPIPNSSHFLFCIFLGKTRIVNVRGEIWKSVLPLTRIPEHTCCGGWNLENCSTITLFSGDSSPGGCASITPWLVELKVVLSVYTFLLTVKPFLKKHLMTSFLLNKWIKIYFPSPRQDFPGSWRKAKQLNGDTQPRKCCRLYN